MKRAIVVTLVVLALSGAAAKPAEAPFAVAKAPFVFHFPNDHGAHSLYQTEWWYFTGHLRAPDRRRFGYELTFFRARLRRESVDEVPAPGSTGRSHWRGDQIYAAHFAITDEAGRKFFHAERAARQALGLGSAATGRLEVRAADWSLLGEPISGPRRERMSLHAAAAANRLDLVLTPLKAPAIHGHDGVVRKGSCATCASHYYSYTRLQTRGTLAYAGTTFKIEGSSWMDHEFGTNQLTADEVGWDWFALQLDDGRELMLYRFRRKDGTYAPQSEGSLVERDGRVRTLAAAQFEVTAAGRWHSPKTQADYPSGWRVAVPSAGIDVNLMPALADQEIGLSNGPSYWEGAVEVRDAKTSRALGRAYVELTGYADPVVM
jgi:predicted secreted hydrolase